MKNKKEPSILTLDDDGHWYLIPESFIVEFESICNRFYELDWDDPERDELEEKMF